MLVARLVVVALSRPPLIIAVMFLRLSLSVDVLRLIGAVLITMGALQRSFLGLLDVRLRGHGALVEAEGVRLEGCCSRHAPNG